MATIKTAAELTWEQIRNQRFLRRMMIVSGVRKATLYESAWLEGSIVKAEFRENKSEDTVRKRSWSLYMLEYISILYSCVNN